jgi:6-pyruvoyltetrahydropterin/6-carboxytetrahydropterin synthase
MYYLTTEDYISSAHQLRGYKGKCENLHGHNWRIILTIKGEKLNDIGLLIDFHEMKDILKKILTRLDHTNINDLDYFKEHNPSSENMASYLFNEASEELKSLNYNEIEVDCITVYESESCRCTYRK